MHRLMLLRHAKSDWSRPGMPDRNRPLNARGRKAAPAMAAHMLSQELVPQRALVSTATRHAGNLEAHDAVFSAQAGNALRDAAI